MGKFKTISSSLNIYFPAKLYFITFLNQNQFMIFLFGFQTVKMHLMKVRDTQECILYETPYRR